MNSPEAAAAGVALVKPLSLRRNFSWTLIGHVCYAGAQWGMLVVLAKLGSPEMVGRFALGLAVSAPVVMFANLQLRAVQATDAKREYAFGHYLALRLVATPAALAVIIGIALVSGYGRETVLVVGAVAVAKAFESVSDVFYGLLQQRERMDRIALSMMVKGPCSLAALGLAVWATGDIFWGVVAMAAAWLAVLVFFDLPSAVFVAGPGESLRPAFEPARLARLAWLAAPLGVVMMLISLNTNIPRYFIKAHLGEYDLGIFAAMAYMLVAGNKVVNALGQSASPRLAKLYAAYRRADYLRLVGKTVLIGLVGGVALVLAMAFAGPTLMRLFYTPEYAQYHAVLVLLSVAGGLGFVASFMGYAMTAARQFVVQAPLFTVVASGSALACYALVPKWGLRGAAVAAVLAMAVQLAGSALVVGLAATKMRAS